LRSVPPALLGSALNHTDYALTSEPNWRRLMPISLLMLPLLIVFQAPDVQGDWRKVTSEAGGFSVTVPGKVEQKTATQPSDDGPIEVRNIVAESQGIRYVATSMALPTRLPENEQIGYFDSVRKSYTTGKGKTLQKEQRGTFHGMPICYFRITTTDAQGQPKVEQSRFIIGDATNLYILQVIIPKGVDVNEDVKRFFDSFKRTEAGERAASNGVAKGPGLDKGKGPGPMVAAKWRPFTPLGKGFSASMPGEPKHANQNPADGSMKIDTYEVDLGDRVYSAVCFELPKGVAEEKIGTALEAMCKDLTSGLKGKVAELKVVQDEGLDGREVLFEFVRPDNSKPAVGRARAFIAGSHAYLMTFTGAKGMADGEEVQKFLESFRITRSSAPAKAKAKGRK
jgi:hypothetical protein